MDVIGALDYFGTGVFAITGAIAAARKKMDLFGVLLVAFLVGNGGGTIRDLLLSKQVFWLNQPATLIVTLFPALIAVVVFHYVAPPKKILLYADAIGLGVFTVVGAHIASAAGKDPSIAAALGMLTGVGGGLLRDIICNEVPLITQKQIYATSAFIGALLYLILTGIVQYYTAMYVGILATILIRVGAIYFKVSLPTFQVKAEK